MDVSCGTHHDGKSDSVGDGVGVTDLMYSLGFEVEPINFYQDNKSTMRMVGNVISIFVIFVINEWRNKRSAHDSEGRDGDRLVNKADSRESVHQASRWIA